MTELDEQLRRLAERGPTSDPRFVIRRAVQRAATDVGTGSGADDSAVAVSLRATLGANESVPGQRRWRAVGLVAAAAVSAAALVGVVQLRSQTVLPATATSSVQPTVTPSTIASSPATTADSKPFVPRQDDPMLMAMMFALLDVPTTGEMVTFLSYNVPQADVAACMHNAGFEYEQEPSPAQQVADDPHFSLSAADFASKYGLGVAAPDLGLLPPQSDPNWNYVQSLSQSDRESYARWHGSCAGATTERTKDTTALNAAFSEFRLRLDSDDRVRAAIAGWRACMATADYDYANPQAMLEAFYSRLNSGIDRDQLQQLFNEEVAVAVANVPCDAAYRSTYRDVATERYGEFRNLVDAARGSPGS